MISSNFSLDIRQLIGQGNDLAQQLNIRLHVNEMKNKELNQTREIYLWAGRESNHNLIHRSGCCFFIDESLLEYIQVKHFFLFFLIVVFISQGSASLCIEFVCSIG